jgi:HAD superfamily hydrolase (TIGR01549 family)
MRNLERERTLKMACAKAVIFDYIGTLVECRNYTMEASREKLHAALIDEGFDVTKDKFLASYIQAHEKYRKIRFEQLREVTNAVWVAEALCNLGFKVAATDHRIKAALNVFFKDYVETLKPRTGARKLVELAAEKCRVALVSNFTFAPVIYSSLRHVGMDAFFSVVVVSEENGWRKPSSHIFHHALSRLQTNANDAVYIGDSPIEDIKGAKQSGLKAVFVPSQFYALKDLSDSKQEPDFVARNIQSIFENFSEIISLQNETKLNKRVKK